MDETRVQRPLWLDYTKVRYRLAVSPLGVAIGTSPVGIFTLGTFFQPGLNLELVNFKRVGPLAHRKNIFPRSMSSSFRRVGLFSRNRGRHMMPSTHALPNDLDTFTYRPHN